MSDETQVARIYKVLPSEFKAAEFDIKQYSAIVPAGTQFQALVENPASWAHVARDLAEDDIIHIRTKDHAWYGRVYVLKVEKQTAKVHPIEYHEFPKGAAVPPEYFVEFGGRHKWRIVRTSDRTVIEHSFSSEADAAARANEISKKLAA
jgi:hypothetical protein